MRVGWIGTGALGSAICQRLSRQYKVTAWNRTFQKVEKLTKYGVQKAYSLQELAEQSDIVFLCIKGVKAYEEILFDSKGLIHYLRPNTLIVDISTISPEHSIQLAQTLQSYNVRYLESPVSGGPEGAIAGKLTAILAGEVSDMQECKFILEEFCSHIHYVGAIGQAQYIKILNNLVESINLLGAAEVIQMGLRLGFSVQTLREVLSSTRGYSVYMGVLLDRLLHPNQEVSASLDVRLKDIKLACEIANAQNAWIPLASLTRGLFELALEKAGAKADQTECIKIYE